MSRKGFTLIELLIVVAIIGILAAIAIPNFLNAQTRAKVARAQAEMKTLQTAAECYFVDNNDYPRNTSEPPYNGVPGSGYCSPDFSHPVAYIKESNLRDPFNDVPGLDDTSEDEIFYSYHPFIHLGWREEFQQVYGSYRLLSYGPDRNYWNTPDNSATPSGWVHSLIYDPTNGTTSFGNIVVCQKHTLMKDQPSPEDLGY